MRTPGCAAQQLEHIRPHSLPLPHTRIHTTNTNTRTPHTYRLNTHIPTNITHTHTHTHTQALHKHHTHADTTLTPTNNNTHAQHTDQFCCGAVNHSPVSVSWSKPHEGEQRERSSGALLGAGLSLGARAVRESGLRDSFSIDRLEETGAPILVSETDEHQGSG